VGRHPVRLTSTTIVGLFVMSVVALALFVMFERRAVDPVLPLRLFRASVFSVCVVLAFKVLTIVVQSTVTYRDLGVATSGVTFFRTLGSSFGAAVFGTVYANILHSTLPAAVAQAGVQPATVATPAELHRHPPAQIAPIVDAYAHAIHVVFLAAVPVAAAAFVLSLFLTEVPLRRTSRAAASDVGEGFAMPHGADSTLELQTAIARVIRGDPRAVAEAIRATSGTTLDVSDGWCLGQVHVRERINADTSIRAIGQRVHVPAQVLKPAFDAARGDGYRAGTDDRLTVTEEGRDEIQKVVTAARAWLATELADWGAGDDALLSQALTTMARQYVDQDESTMN
jgi:hypothetical protein